MSKSLVFTLVRYSQVKPLSVSPFSMSGRRPAAAGLRGISNCLSPDIRARHDDMALLVDNDADAVALVHSQLRLAPATANLWVLGGEEDVDQLDLALDHPHLSMCGHEPLVGQCVDVDRLGRLDRAQGSPCLDRREGARRDVGR